MPATPRSAPILAFTLAVLVAAPPAASAKDDAATAQAKELYKSGTKHYALAEYSAALEDFKEAYRLREDPPFLFNIAQCHRLLGNHDDAIRFYQTYLRQSPTAPNRADVEQHIAAEEKALAAAKEQAARDEATRRREAELKLAAAKAAAKPWYDDTAGWVMAASGLALAGGGAGVLGWGATLHTPSASNVTATQDYRNKQTLAWIVGGVGAGLGAGLLVAGVVKLALRAKETRSAGLLLPVAVPVEGGAVAGVGGAF